MFLAAWENLGGAYRGNSSLQSWLMGIARNKVKDYYRIHLREAYPLEAAKENSVQKLLPRRSTTRTRTNKSPESAERIARKIRIILIWRYWDEYPVKAIAKRIANAKRLW